MKYLTAISSSWWRTKLMWFVAVISILSSFFLYFLGAIHSPLLDPLLQSEKTYLQKYVDNNDQDYREEKLLAKSYWLRYHDVKTNNYWGQNGPMGIWGARDHFVQHGKREGRIFKPINYPENMENEKVLARAYWDRYPEIKKSDVWGSTSQLGILGPRDHYWYRGRFEGKKWGLGQ